MLVVVLLVILGLMMIYSASFILNDDDPAYFLKRQVLWAVLGLILLVLLAQVDYRELAHLALPIMGLSFLSLVVVLFMGGSEGFRIWFLGTSVQPSEFAKLAFIIYIAAWLASKGDKIRDVTYGLIPFAVLLGIVAGLILLEPDIGTAMLIMATAVAMFFISGAEVSQLLVGLMAGAPALYLVLVNSGVAMARLTSYLNLGKDTDGVDYHVVSLLSALRAGGLTGRGLGAGQQKLFPPYVYHTDTILSVIGEELGLIGCLVVVGLFLFIAYRGLAISFRAPDTFGSLLAFGITCWIAFQAMIHVGGNTATIPFTGLTLPFVSYGGSSLTMCLAGVGVLVSISRLGRERTLRTSATFAFGGRNRRPRLSGSRRRRGTSKRGRR